MLNSLPGEIQLNIYLHALAKVAGRLGEIDRRIYEFGVGTGELSLLQLNEERNSQEILIDFLLERFRILRPDVFDS